MELQFLKKQTRAHKYLNKLSHADIHIILNRHVVRLKSISILNLNSYPEVHDEYMEIRDSIVRDARSEIQNEFWNKIKPPKGSTLEVGLKNWMRSI
jgi:hypothetical protein